MTTFAMLGMGLSMSWLLLAAGRMQDIIVRLALIEVRRYFFALSLTLFPLVARLLLAFVGLMLVLMFIRVLEEP